MAIHLDAYWDDARQAERSARFGRFMTVWRKRCGWSQYVLPRWGEDSGFHTPSTGAISGIENGKAKNPEMKLFAGLAEVNRRLVEQDLSGISSRDLKDRIAKGVPVLDRDGKPWQCQQFVEAFHFPHLASGEIWDASGSSSTAAPELTDAELARVNDTIHEALLRLAREVRPLTTALNLATKLAPADQQDGYRDALSGVGYTREALQQLWDQEAGEWAPLVWAKSLRG